MSIFYDIFSQQPRIENVTFHFVTVITIFSYYIRCLTVILKRKSEIRGAVLINFSTILKDAFHLKKNVTTTTEAYCINLKKKKQSGFSS